MAQPKDTGDENKKNDILEIDTMFKQYEERINKFESDICEFPVDNNRITSDDWKAFKAQTFEHMQLCYPLVHGSVISLAYDFLLIKQKYGSEIEKKVYANMKLCEFFDRLATKKCVVFYQSYDSYLLRNGYNDSGHWDYVGTLNEAKIDKYDVTPEKKPKLIDYLSYDELLISAMCGISSPTHFINDGDRRNCGRINKNSFGENSLYPMQGIYMGLVGARFEKYNCMEYGLMAISNQQNKPQNGYGSLPLQAEEKDEKEKDEKNNNNPAIFMDKVDKSANVKDTKIIWRAFEKFYSRSHFPTYDEVKDVCNGSGNGNGNGRYYKREGWGMNGNEYLDRDLYRQRIRISLELFLFDANERGGEYKRLYNMQSGAYCHIVGLGTGVWSFKKSVQDQIIVNVTCDIIKKTKLLNIDCIYFAWMDEDCMNKSEDDDRCAFDKDKGNDMLYINDASGKHQIYVDCGKRAPAEALSSPFEECLTVAMYAWDSNSFPGNEYYHGMLSASGDPAAASCSTISFVQNSEINTECINGENTAVYFYNPQTQQYEFYKFKDIDFENNKDKWLKKSILSAPFKQT